MPEIWFIRHGESESNAGLPTSDTRFIPLTPRGVAQAERAAAAIARPPDLLVASSYLRSKQSAAPAIERFPAARVEEWPIQEFSYLSRASRHNTTAEARRPLVDAYWARCDPLYCEGEGAETFEGVAERAQAILQRLHQIDDDFAVVFSHGMFTRAMLWVFLASPVEIDARAMRRFRGFASGFSVPNGSILKLFVNGSRELFFSHFATSHLSPALL
jgi:2,3-bisphosphoglycerate-dependent phosphoglycerate mutase